jgi:hypothetical protein
VPNRRRVLQLIQGKLAVPTVEPVKPQHDEHEIERCQTEVLEPVRVPDRRLVDVQPGGEQLMNERMREVHGVALPFLRLVPLLTAQRAGRAMAPETNSPH